MLKLDSVLREEKEETPEGSGDVVVEETTEDPTEESEETDESSDEEEESNDDDAEAKRIYSLLKDDTTREIFVRALAEKQGLLNPKTPTEAKEGKKEIRTVLKEALGDKYSFLNDILGDVFEKVLAVKDEEYNEKLTARDQKQLENEVSSAYNRLARETKGESKKLEAKMASLSNKIHPTDPNMTVYEYVRMLHTIASADDNKVKTDAKVVEKIRRNANDTASRLSSAGKGKPSGSAPEKSYKTVREAVEAAAEQIQTRK